MEETNTVVFVLFVIVVVLSISFYNRGKTIKEYKDIINECEVALTDANNKIELLNDSIENASMYAWSDYFSMGNALGELSTENTVYNPCYIPIK